MAIDKRGLERAMWSIAIPGFGQLLNNKYIKGFLLMILEFIINLKANINSIIVLSFLGETDAAIRTANYQWLMFYPCIYLFSIWDAYNDGCEEKSPLLFIPFTMAAYLETVGVIYSKTWRIFGFFWGPIFLPIVFLLCGLGIGFIIRYFILRNQSNKTIRKI